jgi:signal transduction histidine kinase
MLHSVQEGALSEDARGRISSTFPQKPEPASDLASALHDARNLLSIIGANVDCLRGQVGPDVGEVVDDLALATARLHALLESTLARTDRRHARLGLDYRLARVSEIVRNAAGGFRYPPRGIRIEVTRRGEDVVEVDAELVTRVLANLLGNAVRHSPSGGLITLDAEVYGERFSFTVGDDGAGVTPEQREVIFRPGGSGAVHGLGLAFCRRVALEHGGTVELVPSDRGARFMVALPSQQQ